MTPEALAALHARAFPGPPRPWTAAEFVALLADPNVHLFAAPAGDAFLLARRAGPEAEVLTLCTDPAARRQGRARALLAAFEGWAAAAGAESLFLEVAEGNAAALGLYRAAGWRPCGMRRDYYRQAGCAAVHAHVLGKAAGAAAAPGRRGERH